MGADLVEVSSVARLLFTRASEILGYDIAELCFRGPADRLERTNIQQPAIFVTSAAYFEAWLERGGRREAFSRAGGLSLGEYTALYAAGAMDFDTALLLVQRRGALMEEAALASPSGMASLIGADESQAHALCDEFRGSDVLVPANLNCPGQVVISGSRAAIERALAGAERMGLRAVALPVAGAFHSPLMRSAAEGLAEALANAVIRDPGLPVIRNVDARYHEGPQAIREALCQQLTSPVLWQRCVERLIADGVTRFVEFGPGRILTGLLRKINRQIQGVNISTAASLTEFFV